MTNARQRWHRVPPRSRTDSTISAGSIIHLLEFCSISACVDEQTQSGGGFTHPVNSGNHTHSFRVFSTLFRHKAWPSPCSCCCIRDCNACVVLIRSHRESIPDRIMQDNRTPRPLPLRILWQIRYQISIAVGAAILAVFVFPNLAVSLNRTPYSVEGFILLTLQFFPVVMMAWAIRLCLGAFLPMRLAEKLNQ